MLSGKYFLLLILNLFIKNCYAYHLKHVFPLKESMSHVV